MDMPSYQVFEKHSETVDFDSGSAGMQDTTYSQHLDDPTKESNPAGNPETDMSVHHMEKVNREQLLRNIDGLDKLNLIRLSRSSYLKHANRYNIKN